RGIIDPITHKSHGMPLLFEVLYYPYLVLRKQFPVRFIDAQLFCHCIHHRLAVAGEHHGLSNIRAAQLTEGLSRASFDPISDREVPGIAAIDSDYDQSVY